MKTIKKFLVSSLHLTCDALMAHGLFNHFKCKQKTKIVVSLEIWIFWHISNE